jgi:hypothetical protein
VLTRRDLNRTLLLRQHLLTRTATPALGMVEHLLGLQAQENLPPYLSLAARIEGFMPHELSDHLERREAVRLLSMRGTIHVLTPDDALSLRPWVQPALDQLSRSSQPSRPARDVPTAALVDEVRRVLADGPLPVKELGERLADAFPDVPGPALANVARERAPLVQVPPRGLWRRSGGVVYQTVEAYLDGEMQQVDVRELVRRYLRAFGPATPADMTTWSRVTRLGPVFASMREELVEVACEDGRTRYDVPGAPCADGDSDAPVRLLGAYDNLWLSHTDRGRVAHDDVRPRWMGSNGGVANTVFVDGFMAGLWRLRDGHVETELYRTLTPRQRSQLADESGRLEQLLDS